MYIHVHTYIFVTIIIITIVDLTKQGTFIPVKELLLAWRWRRETRVRVNTTQIEELQTCPSHAFGGGITPVRSGSAVFSAKTELET